VMQNGQGNSHIGPAIKFREEPAKPDLRLPGYGVDDARIAREGFSVKR